MSQSSQWSDTSTKVRAASYRNTLPRSSTALSQLPSLPTIESNHLKPPGPEVSDIASQSELETAGDTSFVEFNLGYSQPSAGQSSYLPRRDSLLDLALDSNLQADSATTPERKASKQEPHNDFFAEESAGWSSMQKVTEQDYYDEMGNLEFTQGQDYQNFTGTNRTGYTKIDTEEQLMKYASLDEKTDFLFSSHTLPLKPLDTDDPDVFYEEHDMLDSDDTLAGTKGMLLESQKYAYVGIVKLITVDMAYDLAKLNQKTTSKFAKKLNVGQKNFANWTMYIMSKMFDHLQINAQEKDMVENLSLHGVEAKDLVSSLLLAQLLSSEFEKTIPGFDLRWVLLCDLFLLLLSDGYYDSRSRTLLMRFASLLDIPVLDLRQFERRMVENLEMDTSNKTIENKDDKLRDRLFIEKHIQKNQKRRLAYIGLATIGGSLAIGLSAGLLAPVIGAGLAAGLTTVGISGTGGFLAGVGGSVAITTGGVAIGAKVGNKAGARRMGEVNTFEMKPLHNNKRSNLIITVSGWMNGEMDDVRLPFSTVDPVMGDMFSLLWEPEMLKLMGQTIGILASEALSTSIQQILGATILTALMSAIQLPVLLSKLSYLLDNPWNVSLDRAWKAGKILADTLISGNMGVRPITLVGFSLGSRLIYLCLIELANRGGFGLIENVILLGNPVTIKYEQITLARSVVSGKFINGYARNDWILGYLFRATGGGLLTVGGLSPIENVPGVENFDCTAHVDGHMAYRKAIPKIMKALDWEIFSEEFAEIEEPDIEQKERQRKLLSEFDEARAKMEREQAEQSSKQKGWKSWFKPKQKNWWEIYDDSEKQTNGEVSTNENEEANPQTTGTERSSIGADGREDVFDVSALLQEVHDIEKVGNEAPENVLEKIREDVADSHPKVVLNEDLEEEPKGGMLQAAGSALKFGSKTDS